MHFPDKICPLVAKNINDLMSSNNNSTTKVCATWNSLLSFQSAILARAVLDKIGPKVYSGPFKDMDLIKETLNGSVLPKLLGAYEWELQDAVEDAITKPYKNIINIGCSFGYYAVGFARRMPNTNILAHDIEKNCQVLCKAMAKENKVLDQVTVGGLFKGEDFEKFADEETLVFMDIEGGEQELLNPQKYPALQKMDIIVELHDCITPNLSATIPKLFEETHNIQVLPNVPKPFPISDILGTDYNVGHFDELLVTWDSRVGKTPYGVFTRK